MDSASEQKYNMLMNRSYVNVGTLTDETQKACKKAFALFMTKMNTFDDNKKLIFQKWLLKHNFVFIFWIRQQVLADRLTQRIHDFIANYMVGLRAEARRQWALAHAPPEGSAGGGKRHRRHNRRAKTAGHRKAKARKNTRKLYGGADESVTELIVEEVLNTVANITIDENELGSLFEELEQQESSNTVGTQKKNIDTSLTALNALESVN